MIYFFAGCIIGFIVGWVLAIFTEDMEDFKYGYCAYIQEVVKNSPAFGILRKGDIILTVNGEWIKWKLIATVIKMKEVGDVVKLEILREGMKVPIEMELGVK